MDFLPYTLSASLVLVFLGFLCLVLCLNIFGLPANWMILGLAFLWDLCHPGGKGFGLGFWTAMGALAVAGEICETGLQIIKAKKYGSSSSGAFAGMIGAILGAILLAPFLFGLGALIGALLGAWAGCLCAEIMRGRPANEALNSAFGAMMGRFLGTICKIGIGGAMIALTAHCIWPDNPSGSLREQTGVLAFHFLMPAKAAQSSGVNERV